MDTRPLGTDAVILLDGELVMLERTHEPYEGSWVLPGGYVETDERAREACVRETREEVGLDISPITFLGLYDAPDRDRRNTVSAAFLCRPSEPDQTPEPLEEAKTVETVDPERLDGREIGFDHREIIRDATTLTA